MTQANSNWSRRRSESGRRGSVAGVSRTKETNHTSPFAFAVTAGIAFGVIDVLLMIPLNHPDKKTAMIGAFLSRFAIGLLIPLVKAPMPPWLIGGMVGLLVSLPDAVITTHANCAPIIPARFKEGMVAVLKVERPHVATPTRTAQQALAADEAWAGWSLAAEAPTLA